MALLSDYTAGTVTASAGGLVVTGTGTAWATAKFREGDTFISDGWRCKIASVDSETQITLDQFGGIRGDALTDAEYKLEYMSDGSRASAQARQLIDMLGNGNLTDLASLDNVDVLQLLAIMSLGATPSIPVLTDSTSDLIPSARIEELAGLDNVDNLTELADLADIAGLVALAGLDNVDNLTELADLADIAGLVALAGLDGTGGDKLPYLTGAASSDVVAFAAAARALIAALSGGTAPVFPAGLTAQDVVNVQRATGTTNLYVRQAADALNGLQLYNSATDTGIWSWESGKFFRIGTNNTERLRIATGGQVTMAVQPCLSAPGPASDYTTSSTIIPFGTPSVNRGNHWNTSNNRFTCPVAGNYFVAFSTNLDGGQYAGGVTVQIRRNGAAERYGFSSGGAASGSENRYPSFSLSAIIPCAANDILDLYLGNGFVEAALYTSLTIVLLN